eukprot:CAMPEP_0203847938 /NCGR_PEP_ID=MMETSP0359-20131031/5303_1 /ASSEMBLY_ACC=CAM_ASM_000338 /TAXON_ID=268821 /ORGANISM="Scrippsiella Hangoei, Strain SHTV-5" /LENGTH=38 /DNA_ID= /DNA_START= /DNA_END= /DNA_ORIENTATION=
MAGGYADIENPGSLELPREAAGTPRFKGCKPGPRRPDP